MTAIDLTLTGSSCYSGLCPLGPFFIHGTTEAEETQDIELLVFGSALEEF